jgi:uncharacterized protein (DUF58 family)
MIPAPTAPRAAPTRPVQGVDPQTLLAIRDLELRARMIVEGLWSGLHRSPFTGFSVEFTEYRQYSSGDDLRYLDWRVLARTDREYIKKFEDETNLRCQLLVDISRSMQFGSLAYPKSDYARTLAATFSYFLLQQRDMVGLTLFDDGVKDFMPARWRQGHLRRLLGALERKSDGRETNVGRALEQAAQLWRKRSLVLILSDFLSPVAEWETQLGRLVAAGHDVRAIQVLDPAEQTLHFGKTGEWEDLENGHRLYIDPDQARTRYVERFSEHQAAVRAAFERRGVSYQVAPTNQPFDFVLLTLLRALPRRGANGRQRRNSL